MVLDQFVINIECRRNYMLMQHVQRANYYLPGLNVSGIHHSLISTKNGDAWPWSFLYVTMPWHMESVWERTEKKMLKDNVDHFIKQNTCTLLILLPLAIIKLSLYGHCIFHCI